MLKIIIYPLFSYHCLNRFLNKIQSNRLCNPRFDDVMIREEFVYLFSLNLLVDLFYQLSRYSYLSFMSAFMLYAITIMVHGSWLLFYNFFTQQNKTRSKGRRHLSGEKKKKSKNRTPCRVITVILVVQYNY
jgi:hypothetical protein